MRIITIDFETYWNSKDKYSLSKMGPIEYIRDPRFEPICLGVRIDRGQTCVIRADGIAKVLAALNLQDPDTWVVGHNLSGFDALILSEYYGVHPAHMCDTINLMHWLGLSRIMSCHHKGLTDLLGHGVKQAGTAVSDGKHAGDFTPEEWQFFVQYCADDVTQCSENFYSMIGTGKVKADALKLIDITAHMGTDAIFRIDAPALDHYVHELDDATARAHQALAEYLHFETPEAMLKAIRSRTEFPRLLEQAGVSCPMKPSAANPEVMTPAISKADLEFVKLKDDPNPLVSLLVKTRLEQNSSIQRSRAVKLLSLGGERPVPIPLVAYRAHTGRYAAGTESDITDGLNFQNLSKRDPKQLVIRKAIKAPPGYKVIACDSSQIEARMLAWEAGQWDLVDQFATGRDPYAEMAAKISGMDAQLIHDAAKQNDHPQHDACKRYRNIGKTAILSAGYGVGAQKFSDTLLRQNIRLDDDDEIHLRKAKQAHRVYRRASAAITTFWNVGNNAALTMALGTEPGLYGSFGTGGVFSYGRDYLPCTNRLEAFIALPNGYRMWYPNLHLGSDGRECHYDRLLHGKFVPTKLYGGAVAENVTQSLAFALLAWQACRIRDAGVPLACNIHDAWIAVVPEVDAARAWEIMERCMRTVPDWLPQDNSIPALPIACECEIGDDFTIA